MQSADRAYFSRRSVEEIYAAMRADGIEAETAHLTLAEMYLRRCADCARSATEECDRCLAANICVARGSMRATHLRPGSADGDPARSLTRDGKIVARYPATLSLEERQILQHVARGLSAREVGDAIGTTSRRVERHIDTMRLKLNARNVAHLITRAVAAGMLALPVGH